MHATDPELNISVFASAGSGKTYLLVTRVLRLLLAGVRPEGILAVTFTRMAAGEMQSRLTERLLHWQTLDDSALDAELARMGVTVDPAVRERARRLFETTLLAERPVRTTTFHAFCQDLLARFPLEADVPPGFELVENTSEIEDRAWDALVSEATRTPDGELAGALEHLLTALNGVDSARKALDGFLTHREDWWAWTENEDSPAQFARSRIAESLGADPDADPRIDFLTDPVRADLAEFAALLGKDTPREAALGQALADALAGHGRLAPFDAACGALLRQDGTPRSRNPTRARASRLGGPEAEARFLQLHERLCEHILDTLDRLARQRSLRLNEAWLTAGTRYLAHYGNIKAELRTLDFTDLEWRAYRLLNHGDHALWVQYRLDSRIEHLLIDEFQDTNPTQWRLILPLLEELAAHGERQGRSVFLVGDTKQSIYSFRRADPRLQGIAAGWIRDRLGGRPEHLDRSWRSSPAVMDFVNRVFTASPTLRSALEDFQEHGTHLEDLWGRVEVWPLIEPHDPDGTPPVEGLRNPLTTPRPDTGETLHAREGARIAARIRAMVAEGLVVGRGETARPVGYADITILVRRRTHVQAIEDALRDAGIPYLSAAKGALLEHLEIQDLEALLRVLITPHDDLALAQVLRSPLFSIGHEELERLAEAGRGPWHERLETLAPGLPEAHPLRRAADKLDLWRTWSGALPVHDLLDGIFLDGNVLARYAAGSRPDRVPTVLASLVRFLELALEVDSGRYPSLVHFLARLRGLRDQDEGAPDTPPVRGSTERVRIMTIHAAKGLEAPVVFLADAAAVPQDKQAYETLVDWPAGTDRPRLMQLLPRAADLDRTTAARAASVREIREREDANLLYVALTRARQVLIISASSRNRSNGGWYARISEALACISHHPSTAAADLRAVTGRFMEDGTWAHEAGTPPHAAATAGDQRPPAPVPPELASRLARGAAEVEIAPSRAASDTWEAGDGDEDARLRGIGIHRLLEWLATGSDEDDDALRRRLALELHLDPAHPELADWLAEARAVLAAPALADLFEPRDGSLDYCEVPVQYTAPDGRTVYGIIDRLRVTPDRILLVDYKTHRVADEQQARRVAEAYAVPMTLYADGVRRLWPGREMECRLLFTHIRALIEG